MNVIKTNKDIVFIGQDMDEELINEKWKTGYDDD